MENFVLILFGFMMGMFAFSMGNMILVTKQKNKTNNISNTLTFKKKFEIGEYYKWEVDKDPFSVNYLENIIYVLDIKPNQDGEMYVQYCYCSFDKRTKSINRHKSLFSESESYLHKHYKLCDISEVTRQLIDRYRN
jgi:hypothetical protein